MGETHKRRWIPGDEIVMLDIIREEDKPEFEEITEDQLMYMFKDLIKLDPVNDADPEPVELPSCLNYSIYDAEYYAGKFPGFEENVYEILADVDKKANEENHLSLEMVD